jgi:hypothetical protein
MRLVRHATYRHGRRSGSLPPPTTPTPGSPRCATSLSSRAGSSFRSRSSSRCSRSQTTSPLGCWDCAPRNPAGLTNSSRQLSLVVQRSATGAQLATPTRVDPWLVRPAVWLLSARVAAGVRFDVLVVGQEDLGEDFERPYPPFDEQLAREGGGGAYLGPSAARDREACAARPAIMIGSAHGRREPSHALAQRITASALTWTSSSRYLAATRSPRRFGAARPCDRCSVRAARASRRYSSRRSNFAGVCRICVGYAVDALAKRP